MRGKVDGQGEIYPSFQLEDMVPAHHPLRAVKSRVDKVLGKMSRRFHQPYGKTGWPSVPPERLIKALLLQAIYSIRSEIQLCEQIGYNMLYRWFLDRSPSEKACTPRGLQREPPALRRTRFCQ